MKHGVEMMVRTGKVRHYRVKVSSECRKVPSSRVSKLISIFCHIKIMNALKGSVLAEGVDKTIVDDKMLVNICLRI